MLIYGAVDVVIRSRDQSEQTSNGFRLADFFYKLHAGHAMPNRPASDPLPLGSGS